MILLPILQVILIKITFLAVIVGAGYLFSLGTFYFPGGAAFPSIDLSGGDIAMIVIFFAGGLWLIFFMHGCNHYILSSAVVIWYFNGSDGY